MSDKAIEDVLVEAPFPDRHHRTDRWFYSRSARAVKLRSRRVRPMVKRIRDACPWIENSDLPTLRGYCDLELIGAALMADILENGVLQEGVPRPIIDAVMRVRRTQLGYASALGLSPAARQSITGERDLGCNRPCTRCPRP
jgi:phage terminase small subunit